MVEDVGSLTVVALGVIPAYLLSLATKSAGLLRIASEVEKQGLGRTEFPATPCPEGIPVTVMRTTEELLVATDEVKYMFGPIDSYDGASGLFPCGPISRQPAGSVTIR
ncbi:hypothetical protein [Gordonia oryzae]|uniref:hypothetical protein n=1 Tax=Gordonia oryzae TaxID=2487349 RepID=UPI001FE5A22C|nr:hypothetical protein [Gordonia oryzae]